MLQWKQRRSAKFEHGSKEKMADSCFALQNQNIRDQPKKMAKTRTGALKATLTKLNPKLENPKTIVWYKKQRFGVNSIDNMMN